jgi:glycosyltransferase involved in cell wall biosynthesis
MINLTIIILTFNEEKHIRRCIQNALNLTNNIFIVDSYSTDNTIKIANEYNIKIFSNQWEDNHSKQFNWALNNLPIKTKWIIRLDADELFTAELISEIQNKIDFIPNNINGVVFKRRHYFMNKWIKRGVYPVFLLRMFVYKSAMCETKWMDEHIVLINGNVMYFENDFIDHNLNSMNWFLNKHINYSIREAIDIIENKEFSLSTNIDTIKVKKFKNLYLKLPLFLRPFLYFLYRYFFRLGFLDGIEGFIWHFIQGWWYRTLVDIKIFEIKRNCGNDISKIKSFISYEYKIKI